MGQPRSTHFASRRFAVFLCFIALALTFALSTKELAADAGHRLDLAGRQVMLSHRMAMSLCLVEADVNEGYQNVAQQAIRVFDGSQHALIHGQTLGLERAENNRAVLAALGRVNEMWFNLGPHYWQMSVERAPSEIVSEMIDDNILLTRLTTQTFDEVHAAYAARAADPAVVNLLTQMSMAGILSQRAVKEACFSVQQFRPDEMRGNLGRSLVELKAAMPQLPTLVQRLPMSDTEKSEVMAALQGVLALWSQLEPHLMEVYETGGADKPQLDQLGQISSGLLGAVDLVTRQLLKPPEQ